MKSTSVLNKSKKVFHKFMKGTFNFGTFIEEIVNLWIAPTASISERKILFMKGVFLEVLKNVNLCIYNNGPCYKFQCKYCTFLHFMFTENTQNLPSPFDLFEVLYNNLYTKIVHASRISTIT